MVSEKMSRPNPRKRRTNDSAIIELLKKGFTVNQVSKTLKKSWKIVREVAHSRDDLPKNCSCGKPLSHFGVCKKRHLRLVAIRQAQRTDFDDLSIRIERAIPYGLPQELREDIGQEMTMAVLKSIDDVLARVPEFIRQQRKLGPRLFDIPIDDTPGLANRIAG